MSPRDRALPTFAPSAGETLIGLDALRTRMGVVPPDRIVVRTSGGADSLTLLLTLRTLGFDVIAAHVEDGLGMALLPELLVHRERFHVIAKKIIISLRIRYRTRPQK